MPGSFVFRPIEANLKHNTNWIEKMAPYCVFYVENRRIAGQICKKGGKHPTWTDVITVPFTNQAHVTAQVMDRDKFTKDDAVGTFSIDLKEVEALGRVSKWYPIVYKNKAAGQIFIETSFQGNNQQQRLGGSQQARLSQIGMVQSEVMTKQPQGILKTESSIGQSPKVSKKLTFSDQKGISIEPPQLMEENVIVNTPRVKEPSKIFLEQRQSVTPHKFVKEVEQVEARPSVKQVEIMEPRKVIKDVQYTQLVPVKKTIETFEPHLVTQEVEVVEPRLVTKQIQVVENVKVMRKIEMIESVPVLKEIETLEPRTFTKQMEVTEYFPVMAEVAVTELVPVKKAMEFVEPIITTKTITKEIQEAVVVNEQVAQSIGPAMLAGGEIKQTPVKEVIQQGNQVVSQTVTPTTTYSTTYQRMGLGGEKLVGFENNLRTSSGGMARNPRDLRF